MGTFLKAEWRKLAMANYSVDPKVLEPFLPLHTELDLWEGTCYVSLVGFLFRNTRLKGIKVPRHIDFEEVNLRFYVRYTENGETKRGVVFIREIVPKPALSLVAGAFYGEPYITLPMGYSWTHNDDDLVVDYRWKKGGRWHHLTVTSETELTAIAGNSKEEFITEHFWGYTSRRRGYTSEYGVEHPRWEVYTVKSYDIQVDFAEVYGERFRFLNALQPESVFLAEGSEIRVKGGRKIVR